MRLRRLALLAIVIALGVFIWQLPALLKAIPSRYVAAYLPESLQELAERDHVEMLPTVDVQVDTAALLNRNEPTAKVASRTSLETRPTPSAASTTRVTVTPETLSNESVEVATAPTQTPTDQPTAMPTKIPAPPSARLGPVQHHFQTWNNCGPATLAMALSYFSVFQDQETTASILKPEPEDRNVSPGEMQDYVNHQTELSALSRTNGDLDILRHMLASGLPVIIELGLDPPGEYRWMGWYGHYLLLVAYDDAAEQVWVYDSWFGTSPIPGENADADGRVIPYDELDAYWRQFGRNYIVLYEPTQQATVADIVGEAMDNDVMWRQALERTQDELSLEEDNAFLWFNLGNAFNALGDFESAAAAFDQARSLGLPWRMLWYQFGPYEAYYEIGRYEDVVLLADATLLDRPYFEESYYYRGLAQAAMGENELAKSDLERAVKRNPNYTPAVDALAQLET